MPSARVPRLHHPQALAVGADVVLDKAASRHLLGVLRAQPGERVCLFDGDGHDYAAELVEAGRGARLRVLARAPNPRESPFALTLVQGISRGDRMDATVRQAVELGVRRIVPVTTRRGKVTLDAARAAKRHAHWRAIVVSACEQCGRSRLPALEPIGPLEHWLRRFAAGEAPGAHAAAALGQGLLLTPEAALTLAAAPLADSAGVALVIGPESGLDAAETAAATAAGLHAVRFGPRVLRTETAGPAALAVLQARHGDMLT